MGRKRSRALAVLHSEPPETTKDLDSLHALALAQTAGEICYGDFVYPPQKQAKRCLINSGLAHILNLTGFPLPLLASNNGSVGVRGVFTRPRADHCRKYLLLVSVIL